MSKIQELLENRDDRIDYEQIFSAHPWVLKKGRNCILSPDSDGLLCGLFMSHYLDWTVKGFYDGKVMLLEKELSAKDCVFLDVEIFRKEMKSIGHHMLLYNRSRKPTNWDRFKSCIQPNNMRNYDGYHNFRLKYPLATIHILISIVSSKFKIKIPLSAICPLFFVDGTFNVLFKYPENVLNWLRFLRIEEEFNPLKDVFKNEKYSIHSIMIAMDEFFRERDKINVANERGDRLRISKTDGTPYNIIKQNNAFKIDDNAKERIVRFIKILSHLTRWEYKENEWTWRGLKLYKFTKRDFQRDKLRVNNQNFEKLILKNPLSWAMTSGQNIEYTLEKPDRLL